MDFKKHQSELDRICREENISIMGAFGSSVRPDEKKDSDIDLIIKYADNNKSLFDLVRLEKKLTDLLGKKVDLSTDKAISPYIVDEIEDDLKIIHPKKSGEI